MTENKKFKDMVDRFNSAKEFAEDIKEYDNVYLLWRIITALMQ